MDRKLVLDLCGGTGSWSEPYRIADGYDVIIVDPWYSGEGRLTETVEELCERDIGVGVVHGILAAPPCTHFAMAGAHLYRHKDKDGRTEKGLQTVFACLETIKKLEPVWWVLENPSGRLQKFIGQPAFKFDPCDFGHPYTKKTYLWGKFNTPEKNRVKEELITRNYKTNFMGGKRRELQIIEVTDKNKSIIQLGQDDRMDRSQTRSITPWGFAQAFFKANP